jgi:hypothetical protein
MTVPTANPILPPTGQVRAARFGASLERSQPRLARRVCRLIAVRNWPLTGPIGPHRNPQRKRVKSGRIGRLNALLTGQLLGRALNLMIRFDIVSKRGLRLFEWPVNWRSCPPVQEARRGLLRQVTRRAARTGDEVRRLALSQPRLRIPLSAGASVPASPWPARGAYGIRDRRLAVPPAVPD